MLKIQKGTKKTACKTKHLEAGLDASDIKSDVTNIKSPVAGESILLVGEESGFVYGELSKENRKADEQEGWARIYQKNISRLLFEGGITNAEASVLLLAISQMGYQNKLTIIQSDMARELGLANPSSLSATFRSLVAKDVLQIVTKSTRGNTYRVNPVYAWKGKDVIRSATLEREARKKMRASIKRSEARSAESGFFNAREAVA